jgi:isoleucyl-tRNA synthetase
MSKHLGNILEPIPLLERHGADAVRWYMAAAGSPWSARRVGHAAIQEVVRKTLLTYWNTVAFQSLYGRAAGWTPSTVDPAPADRSVLDRWVLSELSLLVRRVDGAMAAFDPQEAGRLLATFVDDLSNWYVRRSRRRFWRGDPAALATLHDALRTVTLLLAPIVPFVTERVWQDLVVAVDPTAPVSVHLADYPVADETLVDARLGEQVALTRRLVELGRTARAGSGVRTRQPLSRSLASAPGFATLDPALVAEIAAELNVAEVLPVGAADGSLVDTTAKANFRSLGKRFGRRVQAVARVIAAADAASLKRDLAAGTTTVTVDGEPVILEADDVVITETPREGWAVASDAGASLALDLHLTPGLRRAGLAREAVRLVQEARKTSGLQVTDRIDLRYLARDGELIAALAEHRALVADEVLATTFEPGAPAWPATPFEDPDLGVTFWLRRVPVVA